MIGATDKKVKINKNRIFRIVLTNILALILFSCVSVPKETVTLSRVLGSDLIALHNSHRELTALYFGKIKDDINVFVDDVYSPFVIHYVLKAELDRHKIGETSLFSSVENAAQIEGIAEMEEALNSMLEFQEAANDQIQSMRNELLEPVLMQEIQVIDAINKSYEQAIHANITITGYLESARKVKESQSETLSLAGLQGIDSLITGKLLRVSELVNAGLLNNGQRLILIDYQKNKYPKYEVNISGNKLIWKNEAYSLSELAKILLKKEDYTSESVRGPQHWETENRISIKELWDTYLSK